MDGAILSTDGSEGNYYSLRSIVWSPDSTKIAVYRVRPGYKREVHYIESSPEDQVQPKFSSIVYAKPATCLTSSSRCCLTSSRVSRSTSITLSSRILTNCPTRSGAKTAAHSPLLYDEATGAVKNQITRGEWVVRAVQRVDESKRQIWFSAGGTHAGKDPYFASYFRINFDGSGLTELTTADANHNVIYSIDGQLYVDNYSRLDLPNVLEVRKTADNSVVATVEGTRWEDRHLGRDHSAKQLRSVKEVSGDRNHLRRAARGDRYAAYGDHKRYDFFVRHLLGTNPPPWNQVAESTSQSSR